jgi:hypothetical protein
LLPVLYIKVYILRYLNERILPSVGTFQELPQCKPETLRNYRKHCMKFPTKLELAEASAICNLPAEEYGSSSIQTASLDWDIGSFHSIISMY